MICYLKCERVSVMSQSILITTGLSRFPQAKSVDIYPIGEWINVGVLIVYELNTNNNMSSNLCRWWQLLALTLFFCDKLYNVVSCGNTIYNSMPNCITQLNDHDAFILANCEANLIQEDLWYHYVPLARFIKIIKLHYCSIVS